jgi:transcriptional regulator with XRE-family HTH domain
MHRFMRTSLMVNDPEVTHYGDAIFTIRTRMGLTQHALSARLGVSPSVISKAEAGISVPRPQTLWQIAKFATARGMENCERKLNVTAMDEQDRIMARSRHASPPMA